MNVEDSRSDEALDSVEDFIAVGREMAITPMLATGHYQDVASDLLDIGHKLLVANENMARWLNNFLRFDFRSIDSRSRFFDLVARYKAAKAGGDMNEMKFRCGEIEIIYDRALKFRLEELFPDDEAAVERSRSVLRDLTNADKDMVNFIYDSVVSSIDGFVTDAEQYVDQSDLNGAEARRLEFKVASANLSERLERLAGGLAEVMLEYSRLAQRPIPLG